MQDMHTHAGSVEEMLRLAMREMNIKIPYKSKPVNTIAGCLSCKTVVKLRALAKLLSVDKHSSMSKANLVDAVSEKLKDKDVFSSVLLEAPWEEYIQFCKTAQKDKVFFNINERVDFIHLHAIGLMQAFREEGGLVILVPEELKALWLQCGEEIDRLKRREHKIAKYTQSAIRLYGMISIKDLMKLIDRFEPDEFNVSDLRRTILKQISMSRPYYLWNDFVVNPIFGDDLDGLMRLKDEILGIPRYRADKETLISYAEGDYLKGCDEAQSVELFLADITADQRLASSLVLELSELCACGASIDSCFGLLYSCNIEFETENHARDFRDCLIKLWRVTRLWGFCGHTPNEMEKMWWVNGPHADPERIKQIGRNDLCPCGSGLKFKKCCG